MNPINTKQFVFSSVVATIASLLLLVPGDFWWRFYPGMLGISSMILFSRRERIAPATAKTIWALGGLFMFLGTVTILILQIPEHSLVQVTKVLRHPLLVLILWVALEFLSYRRWKLGKTA